MALQPYVPPGTGSSGAIVSYTGQQISAEEREKRIKDVRKPMSARAQMRSEPARGLDTTIRGRLPLVACIALHEACPRSAECMFKPALGSA